VTTGKHLLVVDDNSDMRMYLTRLLSGAFIVTAASDGTEALEAIRTCRPDLVLTDIMMPRLDGFGLLTAIRSDPSLETIPVIMLSARAGEEARAGGLERGADDYVVKPFTARELLATVRAHLAMSRLREEATETLRYRREQVESLLNHAPLGIYLVDADFRIREVNPIAQSVFGNIPEGVIGKDFDEVIHHLWEKEYADEVVRIFRHTLKSGEPFFMPEREDFRIDRKAKEYYDWRLDRITLPDGSFGVVCYFRDVSAQVRARAAIAESEEERKRAAIGLRGIAARARCLLWYADVEDRGDNNLHWVQRMADEEAARRFLPINVPPGQSYGQALADARLPEDRERLAWGDQEVRAGRSYRQEFRVRDANGEVRWLAEDVQTEPIGPNRWHAVGICVDITERKRAEEDREKHHVEIETLNDRLRRAMAETHHRVKNNLQVISALVDLQTMGERSDVPVDELVRIGQHIRSLAAIHDLLTQNAKGSGTEDVILTREVIDKLAPLLQSIVGERSIRFEVDDMALAQRQGTSLAVLVNELVSNAVKHGSGEIEVSLAVVEDRARLAVCDEGPGFSRNFDPVKARNTGLELIETVGRYDLHGSIRYENRPGGGARVVVDFPRPLDPGRESDGNE
jgi:PAS domain S-box